MSVTWSKELQQTVAEVLPGAADAPVGPTDERYLPIPRADRARYLVPIDAPDAANACLRPYGRLHPVRRQIEGRAASAGFSALRRSRQVTRELLYVPRSADDDLRSHLEQALGESRLHLGVPVRPMNPHHKPTVQVVRTDGTTVGFCKLAHRPSTITRLQVEREALARVDRAAPTAIRVPHVLYDGWWRGRYVVVTAGMPRDARKVRAADLAGTFPALHQLLDTPTPTTLRDSEYWDRSRSRLQARRDIEPIMADLLSQAMDVVEDRFADDVAVHGWCHGDWVPWNLALRGDEVWCWDWEHSDVAPFGHDVVHGLVHIPHVLRRRDVVQSFEIGVPRAYEALVGLGLSRRHAQLAIQTYAIEFVLRALEVWDTDLGWQTGTTPEHLKELLHRLVRGNLVADPRGKRSSTRLP